MRADLYSLQVLLLVVSGWVNRRQQDVIAYLVEGNRVLKEQLQDRKLRLTDEQRRRLAAKAKQLGRQTLNRVATIVTPDTLVRWHRRLIALKGTYEAEPGRVVHGTDHSQSDRPRRWLPGRPQASHQVAEGEACCRERLGGLLKHHYRAA